MSQEIEIIKRKKSNGNSGIENTITKTFKKKSLVVPNSMFRLAEERTAKLKIV